MICAPADMISCQSVESKGLSQRGCNTIIWEVKVNGTWLPKPDEALEVTSTKVKKEYESEAGTTLVSVTRQPRLSIAGSWTLSDAWMSQFRSWAAEDTVTVSLYFPSNSELTEYEYQFAIEKESHVKDAKEQLNGGLYQVTVAMEEL